MTTVSVQPGDTLYTLADRVFSSDVTRFPEILDLNPGLDVFGDLPQELNVEIPSTAQIQNYAKPVLSRISQAVGGAGRYLGEAEKLLNQVSGALPPELQGYAQEALGAVGQINGVVGQVEQMLGEGQSVVDGAARQYGDQLVALVPWLLNGK